MARFKQETIDRWAAAYKILFVDKDDAPPKTKPKPLKKTPSKKKGKT